MTASRAGIAILLIPGLMGAPMKKGMEPPEEKEGEEGYARGGRKRKRRSMGGMASPLAVPRLDKRPRKPHGLSAPAMTLGSSNAAPVSAKPSVTAPPPDGEPMASGGRLSADQRQAMPKSEFALPGKGAGPKGAGSGSYPIPDEGHAQSALSLGAQHASPSGLATIKRKVHAKFPDMDVS